MGIFRKPRRLQRGPAIGMLNYNQQVTPRERFRPKVTQPQPKSDQVVLNGRPVLLDKQDQPRYSPRLTPPAGLNVIQLWTTESISGAGFE
jgi:hypothetical protein